MDVARACRSATFRMPRPSTYHALTQQTLPLSEEAFREVISPAYMVFGRTGIGGPQLVEVQRMLSMSTPRSRRMVRRAAWRGHQHLAQAQAELEAAFSMLART